MRFKTKAVEYEFQAQLESVAAAIALYADWYAAQKFDKDLMVTDVSRDQAEYDRIYAQKILEGVYFIGDEGTKHYSGPRPHLADPHAGTVSRAVDFRTIGELTHGKILELKSHLNAEFRRRDGKQTAIYHDVGAGAHLHVQAEAV